MTALEKIVYPSSYSQDAPEADETPAVPSSDKVGFILTVAERAALLECEAIIRKHREGFIQTGHALTRIRESRLYREKYTTFEEYCLEEWEITDRYARNMRSAADVVDVLQEKQFATLPATESQARPLIKLPREEWAPAWEEVVATATNGRVTAGHVTNVVQKRINRISGISTDTEVIAKESKVQSPMPKVIDAGTRDDQVLEATAAARAKLRHLKDLIGMADSPAESKVLLAIQYMEELQDHTWKMMNLKALQKMEREGTK